MKSDQKVWKPWMARVRKAKLPLSVHVNGSQFEVGATNLYGSFRLEDFWNASGVTREECEEYIKRLQEASDKITEDILARTK
jgi:hypothetical protein